MNQQHFKTLLAAGVIAGLAAAGCKSTPDTVIVGPPSSAPTSTPVSVAPSPTPSASPTATPSPVALDFRDDFPGTTLDATKWLASPQSGIIRIQNNTLDVLNTGGQKNFPYIVTRDNVIPATGPFYSEFSYQLVSTGASVSFCLDYLPADQPNETPLTSPFMSTTWFYNDLVLSFATESKVQTFKGLKGAAPGAFHRVRVENDGAQNYRVIFDDTELGKFTSKRRPLKFWLGQNPPKDVPAGANWPRVQMKYVAAGVLTSPDPATPTGTPSGAPTAAPTTAATGPTPTPGATPF